MMSQYQIFLLPVLALAMAILFPLFDKDIRQSSSLKSRRRRRILLGRFTVGALLVATITTEVWPIESLQPLVQGLLTTALLLVPVVMVLWYFSRNFGSARLEMAVPNKAPNKAPGKETSKETGKASDKASTHNHVVRKTAAPTINKVVSDRPQAPDLAPVSNNVAAVTTAEPGPDFTGDTDADVQGYLAKVSDVVQSYELDDPGFTSPNTDDANDVTRKRRDQHVADSTSLMTTSTSDNTDLAKLETGQIVQLVATLRKHKKRLQKMVIAQQAAIATERGAHEKTRVLTRDAITVMRSARTAQKHAEKLARRERSDRQRIELQYKKIAVELRNAMSIIDKRKAAEASNESLSAAGGVPATEKILF